MPRLEKVSRFTIVISDPDLLLSSQLDATLSGKYVFESTRSGIIPHICGLHPYSGHTRYGESCDTSRLKMKGTLRSGRKRTDAKDTLEQLINLYILRVFMSDPLQVPSVDDFHDLIPIPHHRRRGERKRQMLSALRSHERAFYHKDNQRGRAGRSTGRRRTVRPTRGHYGNLEWMGRNGVRKGNEALPSMLFSHPPP